MLQNFKNTWKLSVQILQEVPDTVFNVTYSLELLFHTVQKLVPYELISLHPVFKVKK
jgi:hypothetical protein